MALADHLAAWSGHAYRHIPAQSRFDVRDFRFAGRGLANRWNDPGAPTLYLAGDEGVLIAEWGRHFAVDRDPALRALANERAVYRLTLAVDAVLDLREPAVWEALSLADAPACFLERSVARATANFVRGTTPAQGLIVPSIVFLGRLDRWCLVLFLEKLPGPSRWITAVEPIGLLRRETGGD